ncbi:MAG: hypothetical protein FJ288_00045 [Planctomycetes bacterium]|nr:hypothetical protein [Planctomycetota bacterium]
MKLVIAVVLGLVVAAAGAAAVAVETSKMPAATGAAAPAAGTPGMSTPGAAAGTAPAAAIVRDTAAKPADAAAQRAAAELKARQEALRKAQDLARTRRAMAAARAPVNFENAAVRDVLAYLAEVGKFSIVFDNALQEAGIDLAVRTVTLRLTGMTYEEALNLVLPKECGYRIEAGFVLVTTLEKSWVPLKTATYSIQLALAEVPDFEGPRFEVNTVLAQTRAGGGGGGLFGTTTAAQPDEKGRATPERIIEMIKKFVRNQNDRRVAPWDDEGGPATIQHLGGRLIISQTEHGHRAVAKLLAAIE